MCLLVLVVVAFSSRAKIGENVQPVIPHIALFFFFSFFFEAEFSSRTLIPLFMPGSVHSGSASRDDYGQVFPDKLRVTSFPDRFPTLQRHSQPTPISFGQEGMRI